MIVDSGEVQTTNYCLRTSRYIICTLKLCIIANQNGRSACHRLISMCLYVTIALRCTTFVVWIVVQATGRAEIPERSPSACRCCYYTVDCATTRAHWSISLWKELQFSVSFVKRALVMAEGLMISFDRGMASLYFTPVFIPLPLILLSIFTP